MFRNTLSENLLIRKVWRWKVIRGIMTEEQIAFLRSFDFMKLGNAINMGNKKVAMLTIKKMQANATNAEINVFDKWFQSLRGCVMSGTKSESLQIMTLITQKRVQLLNSLDKKAGETDE